VVKEKITLEIEMKLHQIREQIATEKVWVPIHLDKDFLSNVIRKISCFAFCPECSRIMVIQLPVLEDPAIEGTSDADPVSLNYSCGGNNSRKTNRNL